MVPAAFVVLERAAADAERQGGPPGAAGAGVRGDGEYVAPRTRHRAGARRDLGAAPGHRAGGGGRPLLPPGRALAPRHAAHRPRARGLRCRSAGARRLRGAHPRPLAAALVAREHSRARRRSWPRCSCWSAACRRTKSWRSCASGRRRRRMDVKQMMREMPELSPEKLRLLALLMEDAGIQAPGCRDPSAVHPRRRAAVVRAAAALVHRPAPAGEQRVQHAGRAAADRRARRPRAPPQRRPAGRRGTRCCARASRSVAGEPVQRMDPALRRRVPMPLVDLGGLPADAREAEARRLADAEAARPFDLAAGPVLRPGCCASPTTSTSSSSTCTTSPATAGARRSWCGRSRRRTRRTRGARRPPSPPLPVQYADYAVWQRRAPGGRGAGAAARLLARAAGGAPPVLELPTDRPRPPCSTSAAPSTPSRSRPRRPSGCG
jgi:hypothetical protein